MQINTSSGSSFIIHIAVRPGLTEQGLTSHQAHYRSYRVYRTTKHIIVHIGDDFYRSYDQTNSVKALKETSNSRDSITDEHYLEIA